MMPGSSSSGKKKSTRITDWSQAAITAAELLDTLEEDYKEMDVEVGEVAMVVEITGAIGTENEWTGVFYRCSNPKRWVQVGFLDAARRGVLESSQFVDEDD